MLLHWPYPAPSLAQAVLFDARGQQAHARLRYFQTRIRTLDQSDGFRFRQQIGYLDNLQPATQKRADVPVFSNNLKKENKVR